MIFVQYVKVFMYITKINNRIEEELINYKKIVTANMLLIISKDPSSYLQLGSLIYELSISNNN